MTVSTAVFAVQKIFPLAAWGLLLGGGPIPPGKAELAPWLFHPQNAAVVRQAAVDLGLLGTDELMSFRFGETNVAHATGSIYILRMRARGTTLPYPHDPSGPRSPK